MKKIGREVLFIGTSENNQRNGEGDFIRLNDGRIMFAYTEFIGNHWGDSSIAHIVAIFSSDEGETWSDKTVLVEKPEGSLNIMTVSLLRLGNGDIGIFYGEKYNVPETDEIYMRLWLKRVNDKLEDVAEPVNCIDKKGYFVPQNARNIRTSTGRIIIPVNAYGSVAKDTSPSGGVGYFFMSDDDGKTFYDSGNRIPHPFGEEKYGLQETGVIEMENGRLYAFSRTGSNSQFESFSDDGGITWTTPQPSILFPSPVSPMHVKHLNNNKTIAIFNPKIALGEETTKGAWARTPFAAYVCEGKGENLWKKARFYMLEDDLTCGYCYAAVLPCDDYFLCAYYHSNHAEYCLNACKIVKVNYSELE